MKKQYRNFILIFIGLLVYLFIGLFAPRVYAQECDAGNIASMNLDALTRLNGKCNEALASMEKAVKPHVDELTRMDNAIAAFQGRIKNIEADVTKKAGAIAEGEKELRGFLLVAGKRIRQFYIRNTINTPMTAFLSSFNVGSLLRDMAYRKSVTNEDKKSITHTALSVKDLEDKKKALENERSTLSVLKTDTDRRAGSIRRLVNEAQAYESKLRGVIAAVTAQQEAILTARSGTFTTSVGDVPLPDDSNASPSFNPGFSPAFAGFSFGAYTHKKGMSQYGAKGRAQSGQNYHDILRFYYGRDMSQQNTDGTINVSGVGSVNFEDYYLLGIAEMPSSFPTEALKAQAIAARSYALSYKNSGQSICTSESCQVFRSDKANNPPDAWRQAVRDTRGQIIDGVTAFYSSTTGGYSTTSGWDTICGNQGCWTGDAYEKIAGSPWFYKGWYRENYYNSSASCGRSHPWLTEEEFADILNAWQVRKSGGDASRILPTSINSCPIGGANGNPYSMGELRDRGGFTSVSGVSVTYSSGGYTDTVIVQTNKGEVRIAGSEFKETFNLRAPGYISIRSSLYNIEKR